MSRTRVFLRALLFVGSAFLAACGSDETSGPQGVKILEFEVSPAHLQGSGEVTARWRTAGAVSLELFQQDQPVDLAGVEIAADSILIPVQETATFTLAATGASGETVRAEQTVRVDGPPSIGELIAPAAAQADEAGVATATIGWTGLVRADELRLEASGRDPIELDPTLSSGSVEVSLREETTFTLMATNAAGEDRRSATIAIAMLPSIERFAADRIHLGIGESTLVHWETTNSVRVALWRDGVMVGESALPAGSMEVDFTISATLELRAFNELDTAAIAFLDVEVGPPLIERVSASATSVWLGESVTIDWESRGGSELSLVDDDSGAVICGRTDFAEVANSSCHWLPLDVGLYPLRLAVSNLSGSVSSTIEIIAADGPLISRFEASPEVLAAGDPLELRWVVHDDPAGFAPRIELTDDRGRSHPTDQGFLILQLDEPGFHEFRLEATTEHPNSTPQHATVQVQVYPLEFIATPEHFDDSVHDEVVLSWSAEGADRAVLSELVDGSPVELLAKAGRDAGAGTYPFVPREDRSFRLEIIHGDGSVTVRELEVTVAPTEVVSLEAVPPSFTQGQPIRLSWVARMADEVSVDLGTKDYLLEEIAVPFLDLTEIDGKRLPLTQDCGGAVDTHGCAELRFPDGFTFPFDGDEHDRVGVYTPGYLSFGRGGPLDAVTTNLSFPTDPSLASITMAPFWDSLAWDPIRYPTGNVFYELLEVEGVRMLAIQWKDIGYRNFPTASFNFEVVLREDGAFEFRYGEQSARDTALSSQVVAGTSATIGFQSPSQSDFGMIAFDDQIPMNGSLAHRTLSFRPMPSLSTIGELVFSPYGAQSTVPITLTATRGDVSHSKTISVEVSRKPILELTTETIPPALMGEDFLVGWKTVNANELVVVDEEDRIRYRTEDPVQLGEGLIALSEEVAGLYRYTVRAIGAHAFVTERQISVRVVGSFGIASFTASAESVEAGQDVLLRWEVFEASELKLYAGATEVFSDPSGNQVGSFLVEGLEQETEFRLVISNTSGATEEATIEVGLWDLVIGLQASATKVRPGEPITVDIDARLRDGGDPVRVYGFLPLAEITASNAQYTDISSHPGVVDLAISQSSSSTIKSIELPFPFPYMGTEYSRISTFVDGYISFTTGAAVYASNQMLPTTVGQAVNVHLAPFWDDLHPRAIGKMHTALISPDAFVIQWSKMSMSFGSNNANPHDLNFQLVLFRDGSFEYRYGTMAPHPTYRPTSGCFPNTCVNETAGSSATIGYQATNGAAGFTYHFGGTQPAAGNPPVVDGLSNRTFRYPVITGTGSFTFRPQRSETFTFCAEAASELFCKDLHVEAEFGLRAAAVSKERVAFGESVTLSWESVGGTTLNIHDGDSVVYTTSDLAEIDQGSTVLQPSRDTVYVVELLAGNRKDTLEKVVDVARVDLTASVTPSNGPGDAVTLSWNLSSAAPIDDIHLIKPMEEISNSDFALFDLTTDPEATVLIGANSNATNARLDFDDFVFPFFGTEYDHIRVATDGYLTWETSASAANNATIPSLSGVVANKALLPFWDDLHTWDSGRVLAKKIDPNRYVIQWSQVSIRRGSSSANEGDLNFLVVLQRDGTFEFRYGLMRPPPSPGQPNDCFPASCVNETNGAAATIGYQLPGGIAGYQLHFGGRDPGPNQPTVAGGLESRAWRFSPQTSIGAGSIQLNPADSRTFTICAYEPPSGSLHCAPTIGIEVPWGIDYFGITPAAPKLGQPLTLSWSVIGLDSLTVYAGETQLATYTAPDIPLLGTFESTLDGPTTYKLEATSMGRTLVEERVVSPRSFDLVVTGPTGVHFPGDIVTVDWTLTPHDPGTPVMLTPMSELGTDAFVDISAAEGATELTLSGPEGFATVVFPFSFPYLGTFQDRADVFASGYLSFDGAGGDSVGENAALPLMTRSNSQVHLAVFWDHMRLLGGESVWSYSPDPDTMIIQWKGFSLVEGSSSSDRFDLNFQVVLRSDGSFDYRYGKMEPPPPPFAHPGCSPASCINEANGSSATIGYQSLDTLHGSNLHIGSLMPPEEKPREASDGLRDAFVAFPGGLSQRSFRYTPAPSGSARIVVSRSIDQKVCGFLGGFVECKSVPVEAVASAGDLIISEVMIDPAGGTAGQWFEVRNLSNRTIDLEGFELRSNQGSHRITGSLPVASGAFLTFAASAQVPFTPSYIFGSDVPFNRLIDRLEILAGTVAINSVAWGIDWRIPYNQSLSLDPSLHLTGIQEASSFDTWCASGQSGSPGDIGVGCIDPWYEIDPLSDRPFIDIASTGIRFFEAEGDNVVARLPSDGFRVQLYGETYSRIWISSKGWLSLHDLLPTLTPASTPPDSFPRGTVAHLRGPLISALWGELLCSGRCRVFYERQTIDGAEVLIVQWQDFRFDYWFNPEAAGSLTFQVQLWESGDIVVAFGSVDNPHPLGSGEWAGYMGAGAWTGLESVDPARYSTALHMRPIGLHWRSMHLRPR